MPRLRNGVETAVTATPAVVVMGPPPQGSAPSPVGQARPRAAVLVQNLGAANVRIGDAGVTATTGIRLKTDEIVVFDGDHAVTTDIWAITEAATATVFCTELTWE